jgi:hypothetical protein
MLCACGSRLSNAWSQRWRTDRQAQRKLSARHVNKGGDLSSKISQIVVPLGAEILREACRPG